MAVETRHLSCILHRLRVSWSYLLSPLYVLVLNVSFRHKIVIIGHFVRLAEYEGEYSRGCHTMCHGG